MPASPSPAKRPRQPRMPLEVRREQVLDAALRLITRDGFAATSMEAIAREADLAKPRVYTAYPTRGELITALLEREEQRALVDLAEAMPAFTEDGDFDEVLVAAATNLLRAVTGRPESWSLILAPADEAPPEVRSHVDNGRRFAVERLQALLAWGTRRRAGLAELDQELLAAGLLALGEQAARQVLSDPDSYPPERFAAFARSLLKFLR